jgi:hypothetical protein
MSLSFLGENILFLLTSTNAFEYPRSHHALQGITSIAYDYVSTLYNSHVYT